MADRNKVIKALECCSRAFPRLVECPGCTYEKTCYHNGRNEALLRDALKLLKEQDKLIEEAHEEGFTAGQNNMLEAQAEYQ